MWPTTCYPLDATTAFATGDSAGCTQAQRVCQHGGVCRCINQAFTEQRSRKERRHCPVCYAQLARAGSGGLMENDRTKVALVDIMKAHWASDTSQAASSGAQAATCMGGALSRCLAVPTTTGATAAAKSTTTCSTTAATTATTAAAHPMPPAHVHPPPSRRGEGGRQAPTSAKRQRKLDLNDSD